MQDAIKGHQDSLRRYPQISQQQYLKEGRGGGKGGGGGQQLTLHKPSSFGLARCSSRRYFSGVHMQNAIDVRMATKMLHSLCTQMSEL